MTTQRFEQHEKHAERPKELGDSHVLQQVQNMQQTELPSSFKQPTADHSRAMEGAGTLPKLQLVGDAQKTLGDSNASAADKLSSVENLSKHGIKNIQVADSDGKMRDYSIETHKSGDRNMVHLYGKDDNGQNRIALRGVDNGNGTFSHEKDKNGTDVGFQGSKWGDSGTGHSKVGVTSDNPNNAVKANDGNNTNPAQPGDGTQRDLKQQGDAQAPAAAKSPDAAKAPETPTPADLTKAQDTTADGKVNRHQFDKELQDPKVRAAFAGRLMSEVGSQGAKAMQADAETIMNRAAARGYTLAQALTNEKGHYYPTSKPGHSDNAAALSAVDAAAKGSDITHGATGNASGKVGFGYKGGHREGKEWIPKGTTLSENGEHFGVEARDGQAWMRKYADLQQTELAAK